ncbi:MAG TPA: hypothetical protein VKA64_10165 [Gammaproteobacteria bacterium]|nr:hypothetical protein [Gammaproteobacteria bacterium]
MRRFRTPNRLLIVLLLMAMLPVRAALAWVPGDEAGGSMPPGTAAQLDVQMPGPGAAGCCATGDEAGTEHEAGSCMATCACCAVLATAIAPTAATLSPDPVASVFRLTLTTHPVPLRPPRSIRS